MLTHMKKQCAYVPVPVTPPSDGRWTDSALAALSIPSLKEYFVPLGPVRMGEHRIRLALAQPTTVRVEVISDVFEPVFDECFGAPDARLEVTFSVDEAAEYFLRVRSSRAIVLTDLELRAK